MGDDQVQMFTLEIKGQSANSKKMIIYSLQSAL